MSIDPNKKEFAATERKWKDIIAKHHIKELSVEVDIEQAEIMAKHRIEKLRALSEEERERRKAEGKPVADPNDPWFIECQETIEYLIRAQCLKEQYWKARLNSLLTCAAVTPTKYT